MRLRARRTGLNRQELAMRTHVVSNRSRLNTTLAVHHSISRRNGHIAVPRLVLFLGCRCWAIHWLRHLAGPGESSSALSAGGRTLSKLALFWTRNTVLRCRICTLLLLRGSRRSSLGRRKGLLRAWAGSRATRSWLQLGRVLVGRRLPLVLVVQMRSWTWSGAGPRLSLRRRNLRLKLLQPFYLGLLRHHWTPRRALELWSALKGLLSLLRLL
jgi:hypothetical protein